MQPRRQQQQKFNSMQTKPRSSGGAFSTMPSQQKARSQSNRGSSSVGGSRSKPNRRR